VATRPAEILPANSGSVPRPRLMDAAGRTGVRPLVGVIDIGSNSIRLVVYRDGARVPTMLFNEKVMAGLGAGLAVDGRLHPQACEAALHALGRFALVARAMRVGRLRVVATAAVRLASNGEAFVDAVRRRTGLPVEVIDGETEARASAMGVIAAIPDADGVVGDLGGGSVELVRVHSGEPHARVSLPVGSLKLAALQRHGRAGLRRAIARALDQVDWLGAGAGRPFYMVGGSWRALAQLHMALTSHPLAVVHGYAMGANAPDRLIRTIARMDERTLRGVPGLSQARIPALPGAAALLSAVVERLGASSAVASAWGLREGLLFMDMPPHMRREDPLLAAAAEEGRALARFPEAGPALARWTEPLFHGDPPGWRRIRRAACLLSDVGWNANPDFRAERALDIALHGPWVGVSHGERAMLGATLYACFGGDEAAIASAAWRSLATPEALARARAWGLALRLGQRLGGGSAEVLGQTVLELADGRLSLTLPTGDEALAGASVQRRLRALAAAMGAEPVLA
jgi:exopolyphosphatase/guanosine-5'-triphosphate,3'-diphosphate pyrophosphatase